MFAIHLIKCIFRMQSPSDRYTLARVVDNVYSVRLIVNVNGWFITNNENDTFGQS